MKKIMSVVLSIIMLLSVSTASVYAAENDFSWQTETQQLEEQSARSVTYLYNFNPGVFIDGTVTFNVTPAAGTKLKVMINSASKVQVWVNPLAKKTYNGGSGTQTYTLVENCSGGSYNVKVKVAADYIYGYILQTDF